MNTTLLHRRRVERLAQLLDEAEGARRHHTRSPLDDDLNDLVDVGHRLTDMHPQVEMREAARLRIRAEVMMTAERDGIGITAKTDADPAIGRARVGAIAQTSTDRRPFARRVRARGAVLVGLAIGTLAVSGIAAASGTAMPGDPLYGLKRSQEAAQLQLSGSSASKGQLYLAFASKRMAEARGDIDNPTGLNQLVKEMDSDTVQGAKLLFTDAVANHDRAALQSVADFVQRQTGQSATLKTQMRQAHQPYGSVLSYGVQLDLVLTRWQDITDALGCPPIVPTGADYLGPTVRLCAANGGTTIPPAGHPSVSTAGPGDTRGPSNAWRSRPTVRPWSRWAGMAW